VRSALVALALLSCGCARNAFLELTIQLPPDATRRFAVTQVMGSDTPFDIAWATDDPIAPIQLDVAGQLTQRISIEGDEDNETKPILVKVTFCKQADCLHPDDAKAPFAGIKIERAFYIGKRTSYPWNLECVPEGTCMTPKVKDVAKCSVAGCRAGTTTNYCFGGKHFCEEE
jgi:hypothetical protein